jgi:hypothetical protein
VHMESTTKHSVEDFILLQICTNDQFFVLNQNDHVLNEGYIWYRMDCLRESSTQGI